MLPILQEKIHTAEYLLSEGNGQRSREAVTLAATIEELRSGTVLGVQTATGQYAPYDGSATDGTETAVAILYGHARVSDEAQAVAITAREAEVASARLTGLDEAAREDLAAVGIIVRD